VSFKPGSKPPARQEIARHVELVDWRKLELDHDHRTARLAKSGMAIGLGAIAKGYIVDRASALLRERGLLHHVVEAGGDTYASGTKGGKPWMVGVQDPDGPGIVGAIPATDEAVVTSGDYQRFFEHDGVRYAHILDPRTGGPLRSKDTPKSVTLLASNAADADAYCTAVAVMGAKKGMAWVETHDGIEAVILPRSGPPMVSAGLAGRFVEQRPRAGGD
jgi:thiamine biosynthesis lipoprotein